MRATRERRDYARRLRDKLGPDELLHIPSVSVALRDARNRVLLARHAEGDAWVLPEGGIEPGETPAKAAAREMREETGLDPRVGRLLGVFGWDEFVVRCRHGDRASFVMILFEALSAVGIAVPDGSETLELRWVSESEVADLPLAWWMPSVVPVAFGSG